MTSPTPNGQPSALPPSALPPAGVDLQVVLRSVARFTVVQGALIALIAYGMSHYAWTDAEGQRAVVVSAWVAFFVQILTFGICRLVATQNLIAGWGIGTLLRFATVGVWAFLGIKALGLAPSPALLSLVTFFFVSTVIEPLFLNN